MPTHGRLADNCTNDTCRVASNSPATRTTPTTLSCVKSLICSTQSRRRLTDHGSTKSSLWRRHQRACHYLGPYYSQNSLSKWCLASFSRYVMWVKIKLAFAQAKRKPTVSHTNDLRSCRKINGLTGILITQCSSASVIAACTSGAYFFT